MKAGGSSRVIGLFYYMFKKGSSMIRTSLYSLVVALAVGSWNLSAKTAALDIEPGLARSAFQAFLAEDKDIKARYDRLTPAQRKDLEKLINYCTEIEPVVLPLLLGLADKHQKGLEVVALLTGTPLPVDMLSGK